MEGYVEGVTQMAYGKRVLLREDNEWMYCTCRTQQIIVLRTKLWQYKV